MKVASFFSGIGGIDLGLEQAGMEVEFQCEIDLWSIHSEKTLAESQVGNGYYKSSSQRYSRR